MKKYLTIDGFEGATTKNLRDIQEEMKQNTIKAPNFDKINVKFKEQDNNSNYVSFGKSDE